MATTTPNFGWAVPTSTDLVKDGAVAIETLGDSIDASLVDLKGGTTGQVLTKASGTDMDFSWTAVDPLVILDAKGDLITATAADTPARLAVGANNTVLTADSSTATGLKWAAAAGGGKVLQVVQNTATATVTTTSKAVWIQQAITPSATTSKVLITVCATVGITPNTNSFFSGDIRDVTGGRNLSLFNGGYSTTPGPSFVVSQSYLDSPATASAITYALRVGTGSGGTTSVNSTGDTYSIILMEIGA